MVSRRTFLAASSALFAAAQTQPRNLIAKRFPLAALDADIVPREQFHPYPKAAERDSWEALPSDTRKDLIASGEKQLTAGDWPVLPATVFLEYKRTGNRSHYEHLRDTRRRRLLDLTLAECIEAKGRFLDEILNGLWATCEETYWGLPAHLGAQKAGPGLPDYAEPIVDLFAAETSAQVAWTVYLLEPALAKLSPLLLPRLYYEMDHRILTPNLDRDFGWMGTPRPGRPPASLNNWTPWICSNWLTTALIAERDGKRRIQAIQKLTGCLDRFLNGYADDGGCDEGPGYWDRAGGALFDNLELLRLASNHKINLFDDPLVKEIGRYIYRAHIAGPYFTNFSDAPAKVNLSADMVYRYGKRIDDSKMVALAAWSEAEQAGGKPTGGSLGRLVPALFNLSELRKIKAAPPYVRDAWFPGIGVMIARHQEGSTTGLYLAAQAGHNAKSHNHNDVGNFIVFANGRPAIIDVGVETYSAKTFSSKRYEIWTMQSAFHNCPTIGGVMQASGREHQATKVTREANDAQALLAMNIEEAYPPEAGLTSWRRTFRFDRPGNQIAIQDEYLLSKSVPSITLTLMTPCKAVNSASGELLLSPAGLKVLYDPQTFTPKIEEIAITDSRLRSSWGDKLYRILLDCRNPKPKASWTLRLKT